MGKLKTADVLKAMRLVKKLGLKDEIKDVLAKSDGKDVESLGADIIFLVADRASEESNEKSLYDLISGILEMEPSQVEKIAFLELVKELKNASDIEGWKSFLSSAVQ